MSQSQTTIARSSPAQLAAQTQDRIEVKTLEQERMQDVILVLTHLFEREEATVKIVLSCLYDVGAENLKSKKVRSRALKKVLSILSKILKRPLTFAGLLWFKSQVPQLLADWLQSQVAFDPPEAQKETIEMEANQAMATDIPPAADVRAAVVEELRLQEIQKLRGRVRLLTGSLIVTIALLLGSAAVWIDRELREEQLESVSLTPPDIPLNPNDLR